MHLDIFSKLGGALIALQLQTGILRPGSLVLLNVSLMRAHLGTYPAEFYYSNSRLHKCRTRNYVSTSAENGPAMAGSGAYDVYGLGAIHCMRYHTAVDPFHSTSSALHTYYHLTSVSEET